ERVDDGWEGIGGLVLPNGHVVHSGRRAPSPRKYVLKGGTRVFADRQRGATSGIDEVIAARRPLQFSEIRGRRESVDLLPGLTPAGRTPQAPTPGGTIIGDQCQDDGAVAEVGEHEVRRRKSALTVIDSAPYACVAERHDANSAGA